MAFRVGMLKARPQYRIETAVALHAAACHQSRSAVCKSNCKDYKG